MEITHVTVPLTPIRKKLRNPRCADTSLICCHGCCCCCCCFVGSCWKPHESTCFAESTHFCNDGLDELAGMSLESVFLEAETRRKKNLSIIFLHTCAFLHFCFVQFGHCLWANLEQNEVFRPLLLLLHRWICDAMIVRIGIHISIAAAIFVEKLFF